MGQENSSAFNCGVWDKDNKHEVRGDQAMKIRKMLEQEKNRFQTPSRDYENSTGTNTASRQKSPLHSLSQPYNSLLIEHENIMRLTKQPIPRYSKTEFGFYEPSDVSVANLVESRYNTKMLFPQDQVWKLAQGMLYAIAYLQKRQFRHHDIYPTNIFYGSGTFKLSHPKMATSSYDLTKQRKRFSFLSPELIISLRQEIETIDPRTLYKSDVFSLGMTLLEFCSLRPSCQVYDQDNYDIIDCVIQERLEAIRQTYSPEVARLIGAMLEYQEEHRPTAYELAQIVNQHSRVALQQSVKKQGESQISRVVVQPAGQVMYGGSQVIQTGPQGIPPGIPPAMVQGFPHGIPQGVPQGIPPGVPPGIPQNINPQPPLVSNSIPPNIQQELMRLQQQGLTVAMQTPSKIQQAAQLPPQQFSPHQLLPQQQPPPGYIIRPHSPQVPEQPTHITPTKIQSSKLPQTDLFPVEPAMQQPSLRPPIDNITQNQSRDTLPPTTFNFKQYLSSQKTEFKNTDIPSSYKFQSTNFVSHSSTNNADAFQQKMNRINNELNFKSQSIGLIKPPQPSKDSEYYTSYAKKFDEQSLDERVRKILEKSRQIK